MKHLSAYFVFKKASVLFLNGEILAEYLRLSWYYYFDPQHLEKGNEFVPENVLTHRNVHLITPFVHANLNLEGSKSVPKIQAFNKINLSVLRSVKNSHSYW